MRGILAARAKMDHGWTNGAGEGRPITSDQRQRKPIPEERVPGEGAAVTLPRFPGPQLVEGNENARSDHVPRAARTCGQCAQRCSKGKRDRHSDGDCFSQTRALSRQRLAALGLTVEHGRRLIRRANGGWSVPESTQTAGNRTGRWPGNGMHRGRTRIQATQSDREDPYVYSGESRPQRCPISRVGPDGGGATMYGSKTLALGGEREGEERPRGLAILAQA